MCVWSTLCHSGAMFFAHNKTLGCVLFLKRAFRHENATHFEVFRNINRHTNRTSLIRFRKIKSQFAVKHMTDATQKQQETGGGRRGWRVADKRGSLADYEIEVQAMNPRLETQCLWGFFRLSKRNLACLAIICVDHWHFAHRRDEAFAFCAAIL